MLFLLFRRQNAIQYEALERPLSDFFQKRGASTRRLYYVSELGFRKEYVPQIMRASGFTSTLVVSDDIL